jgi:cyclase
VLILDIEKDIRIVVGDDMESVATIFVDGDDALLVDAHASDGDALALRNLVCGEMGKTVRAIVVTHYMSDHMAGLRLFPGARIIAHRHHMHTFMLQRARTEVEHRNFVAPSVTFGDALSFDWGRHRFELFHNPGHTMSTIAVDVPGADLVLAGDNVVGNISFISSSTPELLDAALARLDALGRGRVVGGHMGLLSGAVFGNARRYLRRLEAKVRDVRAGARDGDADARLRSIQIDSCIEPGIEATSFERFWHGRNLDVIVERNMFPAIGAHAASRSREPCTSGAA